MNFDEAINAHAQWKVKLKSLIAGKGDVDIPKLTVDNACALGQWIYGEGAKFSALPGYQKLRLAHAAFHKQAASVAYRAKSGDATAATASLEGHSYEAASHEVVAAIEALRKVVEGK